MASKKDAKKATAKAVAGPAPATLARPDAYAQVLARAVDAWGLTQLKAGFSFSPEQDRLFALGWPFLFALVEGHPDDADAEAAARRALEASEPAYRNEWPAEVAARVVRALGTAAFARGTLTEAATRALAVGGPLTEAEGRAAVTRLVSSVDPIGQLDVGRTGILLVEAFLGPAPTADALLDALEALDASTWDESIPQSAEAAYQLGFLMLRLPPAARDRVADRARRLHHRVREIAPSSYGEMMLDCVLEGRAGAERSGNQTLSRYGHVLDEPAIITALEQEEIGDFYPSARLAFLAGPGLLERYAERWRELKSVERQRGFFRELEWIADPAVTAIMTALAAKSKVRELAQAWLTAHGS